MKTTKYICKTCKKGFEQTITAKESYGTSAPERTVAIEVCPHCGSDAFEERESPPTKEQLKQYRYLKLEIERETKKLASIPQDNPKYAQLYEIIENHKLRCMALYIKLQSFIYSIDDSLTRQIFQLRYEKGLGWEAVAHQLGFCLTEDCVRMIHNRYLKSLNHNQ